LDWLDRRKRIGVIQLSRNHLDSTIKCFEELSKAVKFKSVGDAESALSSINLVFSHEREADSIRRRITLEVAKSELQPSDRGDLLRLVRLIDWIADWSLEAARILVSAPIHKLPSELMNVVLNMVGKVRECVNAVARCVDKLSEDLEEALKTADQVERLEEEVDGLYQQAREHYPNLDYGNLNPGEAILISQLLDAIEYVADWCENTVDQIRVITVGLF
jgi:predicted phosphate transport protein (TIGR00153 family)